MSDNKLPAVICLGRYGDIVNALPIAFAIHKERGVVPKFATTIQFSSILDGVSYVQPVVWHFDYTDLPKAIGIAKGHEAYVVQAYKHPDSSRLTDSYQTEAWRLAGWLSRFGSIPLVFDKRDAAREKDVDFRASLVTNPYNVNKATILVSGHSVSSPFRMDLVAVVRKAFPGYNVVNLKDVVAHRIYDLIGLIENSACLVTVDTVHLHLSRATQTPVVAIINEGWYGSVPPPNAKVTLRYSDAMGSQDKIIEGIEQCLKK